ncbi:MAG TPA: hypothetical protein VI915_01245 [Thermoplasmata archaeon]|nr:hypothetical protein [Thermoplasmata archaeon]
MAEARRGTGISRWTMDLVPAPFLVPVVVLGSALAWIAVAGGGEAFWIVLALFGIVMSLAALLVHDLRRLRGLPRNPGSRSKHV